MSPIKTLTTSSELEKLVEELLSEDFVTIDTEFIRETTYWPQLCLIQIAGQNQAVLIDPLSPNMSLDSLSHLLQSNITCVFHSGRQDLEIFFNLFSSLPRHVADTQIMAMVCGHGDQIGYEKLVESFCHQKLDKSQRFTDWSKRPLHDAQKRYALADVTYLRDIYEKLQQELIEQGRTNWVQEEHEKLIDLNNYLHDPTLAWQRLKIRDNQDKIFPALCALAELRERYAQTKNIPRSRVFKDDALIQIASARPQTKESLFHLRAVKQQGMEKTLVEKILMLMRNDLPQIAPPKSWKQNRGPKPETLIAMLRMLLKISSDRHAVAPKLLASAEDIDNFARGHEICAPDDWRYPLFWEEAVAFRNGELSLKWNCTKKDVEIVRTS